MDARKRTAIKAALIKTAAAKAKAAKAQEEAKKASDNLLARFQEAGVEKITAETDDDLYTGTLVQPTTLQVDLGTLTDRLTKAQVERVTKRVIDMKAFRDAVASGDIDMEVATECTSETESTPYVKVTTKAGGGGNA